MAGRGMLFAEGPTACPFVALESDRDRRAGEPDPRHRCYAEPTPAPRALAHQREFCLAPTFPGCPIFQDWAVRAAARPVPLRPLGAQLEEQPPAPAGPQQLPAFAEPTPQPAPEQASEPDAVDVEPQSRADRPDAGRQSAGQLIPPPAGQLIPPPYTGDPALQQHVGRSLDPQPIERVPSLPLDPSARADAAQPDPPQADAAGRAGIPDYQPPARRRWTEDWPPAASPPPAAASPLRPAAPASGGTPAPGVAVPLDLAGPGDAAPASAVGGAPQAEGERPLRPQRGGRQAPPSRREEWSAQRADLIPAWERQRYTSYPGLRSRVGLGDGDALLARLTRILAVIAVVTVVIALLLLLPGLFAGGPGPSPTRSPSPSASGPTPTPSPTVTPQPTVSFGTYTVQAGDSLSAIAVEFGLLPCQIQAANPEITDPNQIFIGQVIRIPPDDFALDECLTTPSASP